MARCWGRPVTDGGTDRFSGITGQSKALWLIETGVRINARRAQAIGLVHEVVSRGRALPRALKLAQHIAEYPQASLRADRAAALATFGLGLDEGLLLEAQMGRNVVGDQEMWTELARFAAGDRPEPPRPEG